MESLLPRPIVQNFSEIEPVTVEQRGTERRGKRAPGGSVACAAGDVVMDEPPPRDEGPVARLAAEVAVEELLDLLLRLLLADFDGGVTEKRRVERRRRRRRRGVDQEDARLELDGEEAAAEHGA